MSAFFNQHHNLIASQSRVTISRWLGLAALGSVLVWGVIYLVIINAVATKGFEIKNLEQQLASVKEENKKLEVRSTELQSLDSIEQGLDKSKFVSVQKIEYLATLPPDVGVALK